MASNSFRSLAFSFGLGERILSYTLSMILAALCMSPFTSWPYTPKVSMLSLLKRCTTYNSSKRIVRRDTESFYKALSRESASVHGLNPSYVIYDELYEAKNRDLFGVLKTGMGTCTEPLFVTLRYELVPWYLGRNKKQRGLDWQFSADNARTKLKHLYPIINF